MALNGSGVFVRLYTWVTDRNNSVKITASRMDAEMDGMATALSTALYKDGQQTPTANLPMGGYKLTNLGDATVGSDALNRTSADARYLAIATAAADLKALLDEAVHTISTVASAATTDIGAAATDRVSITGAVTITSLGTDIDAIRFVSFTGAPLLTHNATSLILPTGFNIQVVAGDCAIFASDASGNWRCLDYQRADGSPLVVTTASINANAVTTAKIADNNVTLAKLATQAASTILANLTGGAAVPTAASLSQVLDLIGSAAQGAIIYKDGTGWTFLPAGTARQPLKTQGAGANPAYADAITLATSVAASGASVDFTGIPAGVNRITIMIETLSSNGVSPYMVQIGDSGGIETSGYVGGVTNHNGSVSALFGAGFQICTAVVAANAHSAVIQLNRMTGTTWAEVGNLQCQNTLTTGFSTGAKTLSAALDRVRITTVGGADTFDVGNINISYE